MIKFLNYHLNSSFALGVVFATSMWMIGTALGNWVTG